MAGSVHSEHSAGHQSEGSDSSTITTVQFVEVGGQTLASQVDGEIPLDAPPIDPGNTGYYVENPDGGLGNFYQVDHSGGGVWRFAAETRTWISERREKIKEALIHAAVRGAGGPSTRMGAWISEHGKSVLNSVGDAAPTMIQGAAAFVPGTGGKIVTAVGIVAQFSKVGTEGLDLYREKQENGFIDGTQLAATAGRAISASMNFAAGVAAAAGTDDAVTGRISGAANWVAGAATVADMMHHRHLVQQEAWDQAQMGELQQYGLYRGTQYNPMVGNGPDQWAPIPEPPEAHDSFASSAPGIHHTASGLSGVSAVTVSDLQSPAPPSHPSYTSAASFAPPSGVAGPSNWAETPQSRGSHQEHRRSTAQDLSTTRSRASAKGKRR